MSSADTGSLFPCINHGQISIELLIGNDVPKAHQPWNVIATCGDGPYAIKTILGFRFTWKRVNQRTKTVRRRRL
ncbi:hypothetical protein JOB18_034235 [Solea senegalensis]|uniref:Uncharacterized protein n=1 Tax=Solea senegalensis TaxID=28829 RepID=A0AAV6QNM5_SOLSE|nr:hypothetical protein JOB18_034235 [Solea senegalensis]